MGAPLPWKARLDAMLTACTALGVLPKPNSIVDMMIECGAPMKNLEAVKNHAYSLYIERVIRQSAPELEAALQEAADWLREGEEVE